MLLNCMTRNYTGITLVGLIHDTWYPVWGDVDILANANVCSDIIVKFAGQTLSAHKFIMAARSDFWSSRDLNELSELELTGMTTLEIYFIPVSSLSVIF